MHNWKNIILKVTDTIEDAIKALDQEALRIVMVVDDNDRLIGTVTDGDVRRGLLKHLSSDSPIIEIMFKSPTVALEKDSKESVLLKMKELGVLQIPIVNSDRKIIGLETLQCLMKGDRFDNPVFLMAGGFGSRLQPLTNNTPKPLLKVGTKPILENILNQFIAAGFHNFYISTHYKAEMVRDHFGNGGDWGVSITYLHEDTPLGTAGSLGLLPKKLIDLPILMMNGDLLTKIDFKELLNFHLNEGGDATMCAREYDFQVPYGVIKMNDQHVASIVEKPIHKFFVNAGVYVLNQSMFETIDGVSYLDMPTLIQKRIDDSGQVNVFPVHEYWLDIGQMKQFEQAQKDIVIF